MNKFDVGSIKTPAGFIGYYRQVHRSSNFTLKEGKRDIIFATREDAEKAALKAFLSYLNSPIVSETLTGPAGKRSLSKAEFDKVFRSREKIIGGTRA